MPLPNLRRPACALLAALTLFPPQSLAAVRTWNGSVSSDASVAANWTPAVVPAVGDLMLFDLPMPYTVNLAPLPDTLGLLRVARAYPAISVGRLLLADLEVGSTAGSTSVLILNGRLSVSGACELASDPTATATLAVSAGDSLTLLSSAAPLAAGSAGNGTLSVTNGGDAVVLRRLSIGTGAAGTTGTVHVEDAGSTVRVQPTGTPTHDVGANGANGVIEVLDGGRLEVTAPIYAGLTPGSVGTLTVSSATGDTSRLLVADLSLARNADATPGGDATVTVGPRSVLQVAGTLRTFDEQGGGTGLLRVLSGLASVTSLSMSDAATQLDLQGGTLEVAGGTLDAGTSALVVDAVSDPLLRLSGGANASLAPAASPGLLVGGRYAGQLELVDGANLEVLGQNIVCADTLNSISTVMVESGARLATDGTFVGGRRGSHAMVVRSGGRLEATNLRLGSLAGGSASLVVIDAGSLVTVADRLGVAGTASGAGGSAELKVEGGAALSLGGIGVSGDVWPGGRLALNAGGTLTLAGGLHLRGGDLNADEGVSTGGSIVLESGAHLSGTGDFDTRVRSTDTSAVVGTTVVPLAPAMRAVSPGAGQRPGAGPGTLAIGRPGAADGIDFRGLIEVGARTLVLRDGDSALVRRVVIDGGEVQAPPGGLVVAADGALEGTGRLLGEVRLRGRTAATGPDGLAFAGPVRGVRVDMSGTRHQFLAGSRFEASGIVASSVTVDSGAVVAPTDTLWMGTTDTSTQLVVNGRLEVGPHIVVLDATDTTKVGGDVDLAGGILDSHEWIEVKAGGTLTGEGSVSRVVLGGTLAPGHSAGTLTLTALVCQPTSVTTIELGDHAAGEWDRLGLLLGMAPGGTLDVRFLPGFSAQAGDTFRVITTPMLAGTFANVTLNGGPIAPFMQVVYAPTGVSLVALSSTLDVPAPGAPAGAPRALRFAASGSPGRSPGLELSLPAAADVQVELIDVAGRRLATVCEAALAAGTHRWGSLERLGMPPGLAFARARVSGAGPARELVTRFVRLP